MNVRSLLRATQRGPQLGEGILPGKYSRTLSRTFFSYLMQLLTNESLAVNALIERGTHCALRHGTLWLQCTSGKHIAKKRGSAGWKPMFIDTSVDGKALTCGVLCGFTPERNTSEIQP